MDLETFKLMVKLGIFDLDLRSNEEIEKENNNLKIFQDFINKLNSNNKDDK